MLSQRWTLYDVEDVEGFCGKVLENRLRRWGATLKEDDKEDAMSFLLARAWALSLEFDPWFQATRKRSFSTFLYRRIYRYEVVNWYRLRFRDRRYYEEDPIILSLDAPQVGRKSLAYSDYEAPDGESISKHRGMDEAVSDGEGDPADSCIDLSRVLGG